MTSAFIRSSMEAAYVRTKPFLDNQTDLTFPVPNPTVEVCRKKVEELNELLEDLEPLVNQMDNGYANWNQLRAVMSNVEREADDMVLAKFLTDYDYLNTLLDAQSYVRSIKRARKKFADKIPLETVPLAPVTSTPSSQVLTAVSAAPPQPEDVVLRPMELPKFYGDLQEWPAWWECFEYAVHNANKAKAYKLIILRNALGGEARSAISQVSGDAAGYDEAIKILKTEFGNERAIKENLYYKLQTIRPAQDNRVDLRRFIDEIDQLCASLERMGEDVDSLCIVTGLQDRLPKHIRRRLLNEKRNLPAGQEWTTTRLRRKVREIVRDEDEIERSMARMNLRRESRDRSRDSRYPRDRSRDSSQGSRSAFSGFRRNMDHSQSPARREFYKFSNTSHREVNTDPRLGPEPTMSFLGSDMQKRLLIRNKVLINLSRAGQALTHLPPGLVQALFRLIGIRLTVFSVEFQVT